MKCARVCGTRRRLGWVGLAAMATAVAAAGPARGEEARGEVTELHAYDQGGANDVRDVLVREGEYLVATGRGVVRLERAGEGGGGVKAVPMSAGLPSGNVFSLKQDAEGGVWAMCEGGVGYLARGGREWTAFTGRNGLAVGSVQAMELSGGGRRVWVAGTEGLATATTGRREWKAYPARNLVSVLAAPDESRVWCRRVVASGCSCGRQALTSQLTPGTGAWMDLPDTRNCSHVAASPEYFCPATKKLWLSGGLGVPLLYDPGTNRTKTWPSQPNWERIEKGNVVAYSDWFGRMLPYGDKGGRMWFATNAGLWIYDPGSDAWEIRRRRQKPGCGQALLVRGRDGKKLYWACEGEIAAFDVAGGRWAGLWKHKAASFGDERQELLLSPDEEFLWWVCPGGGVYVGHLPTKVAAHLTDKEAPGLGAPRVVRFDPAAGRAVVGTSRGILLCDYAGRVLARVPLSPCPITQRVERFVFAPDGSEVWCLQDGPGPLSQPAVVLDPRRRTWDEVPRPGTGGRFFDVLFAPDGRTSWLSIAKTPETPVVLERTGIGQAWGPISATLPKHHSQITRLWLSPAGDELWFNNDGSGVFRLVLLSRQLTQYVSSSFRQDEGPRHFELVADYAHEMVFSPDGRYAVCSASGGGDEGVTVIDLRTAQPRSVKTSRPIDRMAPSANPGIVLCWPNAAKDPVGLDLEKARWLDGPPPGPLRDGRQEALSDRLRWAAKADRLTVVRCADPVDRRYLVCALSSGGRGGLYRFDAQGGSLTRVKDVGAASVTALQLGPNGVVWAALPGYVVSVDARTGAISEFD